MRTGDNSDVINPLHGIIISLYFSVEQDLLREAFWLNIGYRPNVGVSFAKRLLILTL